MYTIGLILSYHQDIRTLSTEVEGHLHNSTLNPIIKATQHRMRSCTVQRSLQGKMALNATVLVLTYYLPGIHHKFNRCKTG